MQMSVKQSIGLSCHSVDDACASSMTTENLNKLFVIGASQIRRDRELGLVSGEKILRGYHQYAHISEGKL